MYYMLQKENNRIIIPFCHDSNTLMKCEEKLFSCCMVYWEMKRGNDTELQMMA